jgi:hypothetical protein
MLGICQAHHIPLTAAAAAAWSAVAALQATGVVTKAVLGMQGME